MPIKVLRLIEYTYDTAEVMANDMAHWTHNVPRGVSNGMQMKSAALTPEWVEDEE